MQTQFEYMTKTVAPRIWKSWEIVSQPTVTTGRLAFDSAKQLIDAEEVK
jgi:hypothetical protein